MGTIVNAANIPLDVRTGTVPDVSGSLKDTFQYLTFEPVTKMTTGFQVVETGAPVQFWGLVQPFRPRDLLLMPIGERAWTYLNIFAEPGIVLDVDDVILFLGKQTRIMSREDFQLYGYLRFMAIQDWTGAGPQT